MYILGLSCHYHDSAAALISDGILIAAAEEERFSRIKHDSSFPKKAIKFCLNKASISKSQIDWVIYYEHHFAKFERLLISILQTYPASYKLFSDAMISWFKEKLWVKSLICQELGISPRKVVFVPHHISHAASAYYCSPYEDAAIITADAVGEWTTATIGVAKANKLKIVKEIRFPHSLGLFYSAITAFLGFEVNDGEYKVMGMAAYGKSKFKNQIAKILKVFADGSFLLNLDYFNYVHSNESIYSQRLIDVFGKPRRSNSPFFIKGKEIPAYFKAEIKDLNRQSKQNQHYANVAASAQSRLEDVILAIGKEAYRISRLSNLCFAGGVALNSVANGKLAREGPFGSVFVQPAATDAGGAVGAALYFYHHILGNPRSFVMKHAYWGESVSEPVIGSFLQKQGLNFCKCKSESELIDKVAKKLSQGKIVGWFQGACEWGPRALGNRSILADPRQARMKDKINISVKFREPYRPFAPAVIEGKQNEYFDLNESEQELSKFMLTVVNTNSQARRLLPATTHIDGSSRLQLVAKNTSPKFYNLISQFGGLTGVPVLLNTSFNLKGEPIVSSANDAVKTFIASGLDILAIDNFLVFKNQVLND